MLWLMVLPCVNQFNSLDLCPRLRNGSLGLEDFSLLPVLMICDSKLTIPS